MPSLKEELKDITGRRKRFLLMRIADVEPEVARNLCGVPKGTYNTWTSDPNCKFVSLYRKRKEFAGLYKQEAIQMLRRDNQLAVVLLEEKIINKMREELETGEYILIRTNIARDVYSKLIGDLDLVPQSTVISWEQRLQNIFLPQQEVQRGQIIEAEGHILDQPSQSEDESESEQTSPETEEEVQE